MQAAQMDSAVEGGLENPVFGSQMIFKAVMDAFAGPGVIADIGQLVSAPPPLVPAAAAFLAVLADYDTPVWLGERTVRDAARWITFQTGAPVVGDPAAAAFAVLDPKGDVDDWSRFPIGSAEYPDHSATLLLSVASFSGGERLILTGPGIETSRDVAPAGLPSDFVAAMAANAALFPRGLDVLLVCGSELLALPRTTRIQEG